MKNFPFVDIINRVKKRKLTGFKEVYLHSTYKYTKKKLTRRQRTMLVSEKEWEKQRVNPRKENLFE